MTHGGLRPLDGRRARLPGSRNAASFLPQGVAVVGELDLEGKLFPRVVAGVVYPLSPDGECAQRLQMGRVAPPVLLQRRQHLRVAGVQPDDCALGEAALFVTPMPRFLASTNSLTGCST
jgi:hypothetical protein